MQRFRSRPYFPKRGYPTTSYPLLVAGLFQIYLHLLGSPRQLRYGVFPEGQLVLSQELLPRETSGLISGPSRGLMCPMGEDRYSVSERRKSTKGVDISKGESLQKL